MQLTRHRYPAVVALATAAFVAAIQPAPAAEIGSVPPSEAAAQLKLGMSSDMTPDAATSTLADLEVAPDGSMTGYSRDEFPHWRDASTHGWPVEPSNSCNARNAALYRDGTDVSMSDSCTNLTGTWKDPYSAKVYDSTSDIDIDHMVPLANAWRSGADSWTTDKRTAFANNPLVLVSAKDTLNQSKGDKGPEAWKPPLAESHCLYAVRWVFVKDTYGLSVNSAEKTSLSGMLETC